MPIYKDVHEVPETNHGELAEAHKKDLEIQDDFGVKILTYWHDNERGTVFCLIDAPSEDSIRQLHSHAHGNVPNQIISVDIMAVKSFLGRISDPLPDDFTQFGAGESEVDGAFRAIMFTDLKDSTAMTSRLGEERALELLELHNRLIRGALRDHGGSEVKHTGDGIMASFASCSDGISSAIAIEQAFATHNSAHPDEEMYVRIGLHGGEPVERSGDLFGSTIQMAARLYTKCELGRILVSEVVRNSCESSNIPFVDMGQMKVKGFEVPVDVYTVSWSSD